MRSKWSRFALASSWLCVAAALAPHGGLQAQRGAGPGGQQSESSSGGTAQAAKPEAAQVGAGTTNGATTGTSHPMRDGGKSSEPEPPSASLCEDYHGDVRQACLEVVLRGMLADRRAARPERTAERPTRQAVTAVLSPGIAPTGKE